MLRAYIIKYLGCPIPDLRIIACQASGRKLEIRQFLTLPHGGDDLERQSQIFGGEIFKTSIENQH